MIMSLLLKKNVGGRVQRAVPVDEYGDAITAAPGRRA